MAFNPQRRSSATQHPPAMSSHTSPSGSYLDPYYTRGPHPSPYYISDAAHALDAFATVNRALGARNNRQSAPIVVQRAPRAPKAPAPLPQPQPHSRTLRNAEVVGNRALYPNNVARPSHDQERMDPRLEAVYAAAYTRAPGAGLSDNPSRYNTYPRETANKQHIPPARPVLRLITPSSPQWPTEHESQVREKTFQDMGFQPAPLKDRSSCIIM